MDFIKLSIDNERSRMSQSSLDKASDCVEALKAYIGDKDRDVRDAPYFDFIYGFGSFITEAYERRYAPATAAECLRTLRKYLRTAISLGLIPNIDNVPAATEALCRDAWGCQVSSKSQSTKPLKLDTARHVDTLTRALDAWRVKRLMANEKTADRVERELALQTRCAAVYLFCIMNHGIEIKDALSIKRSDDSGDFAVEKYGARLPLSPASLVLAEIYNNGAASGEHLFSTLDNSKYKGNPETAATLIESRVIKYLKRSGLPLYSRRTVAVDWINLAIDEGIDTPLAEKLWGLSRGRLTAADAMDALQESQRLRGGRSDRITERWYLLRLTSPSLRRNRFVKMFASSGIMGSEEGASKRIYAPEETREGNGEGHSVLGRYVFFRATAAQARFADTFSPHARVLRGRGVDGFARVDQREIADLQIMLRDFPEGVEIVNGKDWLAKHNAEIVPGRKAVIRSGSLAGREATVIKVKGQNSEFPTYLLEFAEGAIRFRTDLSGVDLEIVSTPLE